jgi:hypothetical protein
MRTGISRTTKQPSVCITYTGDAAARIVRHQDMLNAVRRGRMQATPCQQQQAPDMRSAYDAHRALARDFTQPTTAEQMRALEVLQAERETAERIMRERNARRFSFA